MEGRKSQIRLYLCSFRISVNKVKFGLAGDADMVVCWFCHWHDVVYAHPSICIHVATDKLMQYIFANAVIAFNEWKNQHISLDMGP